MSRVFTMYHSGNKHELVQGVSEKKVCHWEECVQRLNSCKWTFYHKVPVVTESTLCSTFDLFSRLFPEAPCTIICIHDSSCARWHYWEFRRVYR